MLTLATGIAIGAAFSPFWIKVYTVGKAQVKKFMASTK